MPRETYKLTLLLHLCTNNNYIIIPKKTCREKIQHRKNTLLNQEWNCITNSKLCVQKLFVSFTFILPTTCGSSGKSLFGFFTVLVDSLRVGILAAFALTEGMGSPIPLTGVVGVVVSAFLFTPFLTYKQISSNTKLLDLVMESSTHSAVLLEICKSDLLSCQFLFPDRQGFRITRTQNCRFCAVVL